MAKNIREGFAQVGEEGTVAVYLPHHSNCASAVGFSRVAFAEALRKHWVIGHVEVWFNDRTRIDLN